MIKLKRLKAVMMITVMVFVGLLYTSNSYAYQEETGTSNLDFSILEVNLETGEEI